MYGNIDLVLSPGCDAGADILFVVDISGSVRHEHFPEVKNFLADIVDEFEFSQTRDDKTQVSVITFDSEARVEFYLNEYDTKQDVQNAIQRIRYRGGHTNIPAAIELAMFEVGLLCHITNSTRYIHVCHDMRGTLIKKKFTIKIPLK